MQRRKHEWFQALGCVYFILYGVFALANMSKYGGSVLNAAFPTVMRYVFATWLVIIPSGVLVEMFRTRSPTAVLRERAALLMLAGLCIVYGIWALILLPPRGIGFTLFWLTIAVACLLNAWEIGRPVRSEPHGGSRLASAYRRWVAGTDYRRGDVDQGEAGSSENGR